MANVTTDNNETAHIPWLFDISPEDTNWVITSSFMIFTMQTGFGMLESGCVSIKNEVNIMMKNVADIVLGGLTYWIFGFALSFGRSEVNNGFLALGDFFIDPPLSDPLKGGVYAAFIFQLSFATTATTIVSGAMAERCNFKAYCLFSFLNTIIYCIPAGWIWGEHGFLKKLGAVDIAGSGAVHLIGGSAALASALMLGPRLGRYDKGIGPLPLGNPVNAVMGLFVLWWGWLAFNSGSTYGLSGAKWHYAARAAVMTMMSTFGGGTVSILYTMVKLQGKIDALDIINGILGSLVAITGGCFLYRGWEALLIGTIGALLTCSAMPLFDLAGIDDPVGASAVHGVGGIWGVLAVGLFADNPAPLDTTNGRCGLFKGGGWYLLGIQALTVVCLLTWGLVTTSLLLWAINKVITIRMEVHVELLGADLTEHLVKHGNVNVVGVSRAVSALTSAIDTSEISRLHNIGLNPAHNKQIQMIGDMKNKKRLRLPAIFKEIIRNRDLGINNAKKLIPRRKKKANLDTTGNFVVKKRPPSSTVPEDNKVLNIAWVN
ncbi:unnamed protein product [Callosobruchus maculatus]|uniref:Ammonium transporter n=2 Tax=Callosobruchus maculatus TaxID=64391 RepID=A0A653D6Z9_CALMS|nr:unnamed protein product [Callosobruchus maculatus]